MMDMLFNCFCMIVDVIMSMLTIAICLSVYSVWKEILCHIIDMAERHIVVSFYWSHLAKGEKCIP